jgi:hypothetical protein
MAGMHAAIVSALSSFPRQLQELYAMFPASHCHWAPESWDGIPSEMLTAREQLCHVRDIEIDGYHVRLRRLVDETRPTLASVDTYALAKERRYGEADAAQALAAFARARAATVELVRGLSPAQLARAGSFDGYGPVTVRSVIHFLCSHDQQHLAGLHWLLGKIHAGVR